MAFSLFCQYGKMPKLLSVEISNKAEMESIVISMKTQQCYFSMHE